MTTNIPKSTAQRTISLSAPSRTSAESQRATENKHNSQARSGSHRDTTRQRLLRKGLMSRPCSATPTIFSAVAEMPATQREMDAGKSAAKLGAAPRTLAHFCEECTLEEHLLAPSLAALLRKSTTCATSEASAFARVKGKEPSCPDSWRRGHRGRWPSPQSLARQLTTGAHPIGGERALTSPPTRCCRCLPQPQPPSPQRRTPSPALPGTNQANRHSVTALSPVILPSASDTKDTTM